MSDSDFRCSSCGNVHDHTPWWKPGKVVKTHGQEKYNGNKRGNKRG